MEHHRPAAVRYILQTTLLTLICCFSSSAALAEFQRTKIAVLDFEQLGAPCDTKDIGSIVAEWFTIGMVRSGRFEVTERAMLQKIIKEQAPQSSGRSENSAATLGRILGVKVVATGSVDKDRQGVAVQARVVNVESGEIVAAENLRTATEGDLHRLVDELAARIVRNLPLTGYVVKRDAGSVVIDLGLDAGLAPGTEFIVYREGEVIRHPKTGEILDIKKIHTGRLRITRISKNVAEGEIQKEERGGIKEGQLVQSVCKEGKAGPAKDRKTSTL